MRTALQTIRRTAVGVALVALAAGAVHAAIGVLGRTWVREFQAGASSPASERAQAILLQGAIEAAGFGALALVLAALTALLARRGPAVERAERACAAFLLLGGAFASWTSDGAWLAEEALAFLRPGALALVDAAGFALFALGFFVFAALARALAPLVRGSRSRAAIGLAAGVLLAVAVHQARFALTRGSGGWRSPARLGLGLGWVAGALVATPLVARLVAGPLEALVRRLARGPLLPRGVRVALGLALLAWVLAAVPFWSTTSVAPEIAYRTLPARGEPSGPNVVLVTIDTLRNDHLSCYGYPRPTSPRIDALAAGGVRCADPSASAAWTKPATGTILTGLYPSRHGALYHGSVLQLPEGERTLAQAFQQAGYVTAGFVSNPNLKRVFRFDRGFDEYFDSPVEDTVALASMRASWFGAVLMRLARYQFNWNYENDVTRMNGHILPWLEQNRANRFFLYLHYIDPHIPYTPPEPYRTDFEQDHGLVLFNERKEKVGIDLYDGEIRYMDEGLGKLIDRLGALGLWESTLFVVTSDHGEEFFEHGVLGHGFSLYQPVVGVPLVLHGPGVPAGRVVEDPVQILDMPATLLELAGTGQTKLGDGASFASLVRGDPEGAARSLYIESEFGQDEHDIRSFVFSGVREGRWKLVLTEANAWFPPQNPRYGAEALYDLESDPGETRNLFHDPAHKELVQRLLGELTRHATFLQEKGFRDVEPTALDPETLAQLKAMGYL